MPRPARLRVPALEQFVEEQRYTPRRAIERQVERVEDLALELDASRAYPEDWVVARITGFRPRIDEPRMIVGEALLGDLGALAGRLTEQAGMVVERGDEGEFLSVEALGERWGVSRRTIDRYRAHGLVGRRVRVPGGRIQVRFARRHIEVFESVHADVIGRGAAFRRVSEEERARMARLALGYIDRLGWSRHQAIGRIAVRMGVSRETVRRALQHAGDDAVVRDGALDARMRRLVLRADDRGIAVGKIAERVGRSAATVHRVALGERIARLRGVDVWGFGDEARVRMERLEGALDAESVQRAPVVVARREVVAFLEEAHGMGKVDAVRERELVAGSMFLRARAAVGLGGLDEARPSAAGLDEVETDLRWASRLLANLVRMHLGLIERTIEDRLGREWAASSIAEVRAVHRGAMRAACGAVMHHDPVRGGRLAAPLGLAVNRVVARLAPEEGRRVERGVARRQIPVGEVLEDWRMWAAGWSVWLDPAAWLIGGSVDAESGVGEESRRCVMLRYGLDGGPPRTMREVGEAMDLEDGGAGAARRVRRAVREWRAARGRSGM